MSKFTIWLALLIVTAATADQRLHRTRDRNFILRQEFVYQIFYKPDDLSNNFADIIEKAKDLKITDLRSLPVNQDAVDRYVQRYNGPGLLPPNRAATVFHPIHLAEIKELFDVLYSADNFETFALVSLWSKMESNGILWYFAVAVAVLHRRDTRLLRIPNMHESLPQYFYNKDVVDRLNDIRDVHECSNELNEHIINVEYSERISQPQGVSDPEARLTYLTEDVAMSNYYFFLVLDLPYFLNSSYYRLPSRRRGERYFDDHRQYMARYELERLPNGLDQVANLTYYDYLNGFYSNMEDYNGIAIPTRPSRSDVQIEKEKYAHLAETFKKRIHAAAETGVLHSKNGESFDDKDLFFNEFMNAVQGNADSINYPYYGDFEIATRHILGYAEEPKDSAHVIIGSMENYNVALRDPAFYSMFIQIVGFGWRCKTSRYKRYTREDLAFPDVSIEKLDVSEIVTHFEKFDSILGNQQCRSGRKVPIIARQKRLNHNDFSVDLRVNAQKANKAIVRLFLGPKYDFDGEEINVDRARHRFFQLDQFLINLKQGVNRITRKDSDFTFQVDELVRSDVFYERIEQAVDNKTSFGYYERPYGYPRHIIIPKGTSDGLHLRLLAIVSPVEKIYKVDTLVNGRELDDGRSLGFPIDKGLDDDVLELDNLMVKEVIVYHK